MRRRFPRMRRWFLAWILAVGLTLFPACGAAGAPGEASGPSFIPREALQEEKVRWVELSEAFCTAGVVVSGELSDQDKAAFFRYIISGDLYEGKREGWRTPEGFAIPLADVEEVIFTHLDTAAFDPVAGFPSPTQWQWYDAQGQVYHTAGVGGYGGARALEVLEFAREESRVRVVLGLYDMERFYGDPPEHVLVDRWEVEFLLLGEGERDFKVLRSGPMGG